ncbi:MAG TPA: hypothetical protein VIX59_03485 [Candidatus Binataceae bacterium]
MNRKKTIAAFAVLAATVALAPAGSAFAFSGGFPIGGFPYNAQGINIGANAMSVGQLPESSLSANPDNVSAVFYSGELHIDGKVAAGSTLPQGATLVQLRVNGRIIPMALDTRVATAELGANPTNDYNKALYNSVLNKQMVVIGNADLRNQITAAADSSKPLVLHGYVFDRTSPYFVVRSVSDKD